MWIIGANPPQKVKMVDMVDDILLVEIGGRLDPGSLLSLSRVSTAFYLIFSPALRRYIKANKYCKHRGVAIGMSGSMALLRWASLYFLAPPRSDRSVSDLRCQIIVGAVQNGDFKFLLEYLSEPGQFLPTTSRSETSMIHRAAGRSGRWDLIQYLQDRFPVIEGSLGGSSMNHVAAGALEANNFPLFLQASPIIDLKQLRFAYSPAFEFQNSWITLAVETLPFPSDSFLAFQRHFKTVYDNMDARQFRRRYNLIALQRTLCGMVLGASVAIDIKLGVVEWLASCFQLTPVEFSEIYLNIACSRNGLFGPIFHFFDARYGLLDCCRNNMLLLRRVLVDSRCDAEMMDFIECCLSKNMVTSELAAPLVTKIASSAWNARSLAVMKALQALPGFAFERNVLETFLTSWRSLGSAELPQDPDVVKELVAWLKSLGANLNRRSIKPFLNIHECLVKLKFVFSAFGDDLFLRDDSSIHQAFETSLNWSSSNDVSGLLDCLHSKGFVVMERPYTNAVLHIYRSYSKPTFRALASPGGKLLPYFEWLLGKDIPIDSDVLSWALALELEELSAWLMERKCPISNNSFSFAVLVELHLAGNGHFDTLRLKAKVELLLGRGYVFDGDTLETVFRYSTLENLDSLLRSTSPFSLDAFSSILDVFIAAGCPLTEKFFAFLLEAPSPIPESMRLGLIMKVNSLNCPRPPLAVALAYALSEKTCDIQVIKFLIDNGYEVPPGLAPRVLLEVLSVDSDSGYLHSDDAPPHIESDVAGLNNAVGVLESQIEGFELGFEQDSDGSDGEY